MSHNKSYIEVAKVDELLNFTISNIFKIIWKIWSYKSVNLAINVFHGHFMYEYLMEQLFSTTLSIWYIMIMWTFSWMH